MYSAAPANWATRTFVEEVLPPLKRCSQCILQPQLIESPGHSWRSLTSAEMQSAYSTVLADWTKIIKVIKCSASEKSYRDFDSEIFNFKIRKFVSWVTVTVRPRALEVQSRPNAAQRKLIQRELQHVGDISLYLEIEWKDMLPPLPLSLSLSPSLSLSLGVTTITRKKQKTMISSNQRTHLCRALGVTLRPSSPSLPCQ